MYFILQLLQKLLNCVSSFLKSHGICSSTISGAVKELREHDEFLQSLQSSISELHVMSQSLKAHTSTVIKQKVLYLVDRIDRRVRERVSVVEKRITALRMIQELHDINEKVLILYTACLVFFYISSIKNHLLCPILTVFSLSFSVLLFLYISSLSLFLTIIPLSFSLHSSFPFSVLC